MRFAAGSVRRNMGFAEVAEILFTFGWTTLTPQGILRSSNRSSNVRGDASRGSNSAG